MFIVAKKLETQGAEQKDNQESHEETLHEQRSLCKVQETTTFEGARSITKRILHSSPEENPQNLKENSTSDEGKENPCAHQFLD